jgi:type II secretory pathway component PulK
MVLIIMVVLVSLALGFASMMAVETKLARTAVVDNDLFWVAYAGVEAAKSELAADLQGPDAQTDSAFDFWAGGSGLPGPAGETNAAPLFPGQRIDTGPNSYATWKTVDLDQKFNINIAKDNPDILRGALTLVGVDPAEQATIVDSIQDWCDPDDDKRPSGAESDFYRQGQGPVRGAYIAKNGPIDDVSELLMINGITPAMYYGNSGAGNVGARSQVSSARRSHFEEVIYSVGLRDLFTAISGRALNINMASKEALQCIPQIDDTIADAIIQRRSERPIHNINELAGIPGLPPPVLQQIGRFVSYRSVVFEITVTANVRGTARTYKAIVRRATRDIQTLTMYQDWDATQSP